MKSNKIVILALLGAFLLPAQAHAQSCDARFTFDGNLTDASGNGNDGQMIGKGSIPATPNFVAGKSGQALQLDGTSAMRSFVDLHPDSCPQVTIAAWIQITDANRKGTQTLFSTGSGSGPGMTASSAHLGLKGPANGLLQRNVIRPNSGWLFVAGVYDYTNGTYVLHWRNRSLAGKLGENPKPPEEAIWVGAFNDGLGNPASGMVIDELRIIGKALTEEDIRTLQADSGVTTIASAFTLQEVVSCATQDDCAAGTYCAFDNTCHPESHLPKRTFELQEVESAPTLLTLGDDAGTGTDGPRYSQPDGLPLPGTLLPGETSGTGSESSDSGTATGDDEQMPAPTVNAIMDLQKLRITSQHENRGDEYYLVTYKLRGRRGADDRIYTFDYGRQLWSVAPDKNWAKSGLEFNIPQGAGRLTFNDLKPFEVYGFVAVLMEANNNTVQERTNAFGFGEFQNEEGVTETVGGAFERAIPRSVARPDYADTACANVLDIYSENYQDLAIHFGSHALHNSGLSKAIQDVIEVPLKRSGRDSFDGAIWSFYMNVPGGDACISSPPVSNFFPPPGERLKFETLHTEIHGEHRR